MYVFLKAQASSLSASIIDFLITFLCVNVIGFWYVLGSIIGTITGGCVNFYMGRNWTFNATQKSIKLQIVKYIIVWIGNLLLVTAGVYILTHFLGLNYMVSKITASVLMGTTYNYLMQKQFIFIH
ncbi:GtrA family protein [Pedobacter sp. ok626]|uniref:GtrA family protein n=1 Tax=Pedobacter sp. ok626 TaxID=1761882 RepID=UPI000B81461D|nr:GtrA family protein [Pedobacter sp. ok626]